MSFPSIRPVHVRQLTGNRTLHLIPTNRTSLSLSNHRLCHTTIPTTFHATNLLFHNGYIKSINQWEYQQTTTTLAPALSLARSSTLCSSRTATATPLHTQVIRHASSIPSNIGRSVNVNQAAESAKNLIDRVASASEAELYHWSSIAVAASFPPALLLSPWFLAVPFDLALGIAIPLHSHIGVVQIIEDYVPREHQGLAKTALIVVTFITTIGLLKINLCGKGISESFKSLWRRPNVKKQVADDLNKVTEKSKKLK